MEEKEILRKEKELTGTVKLPAEAESYKLEALAEGKRCVLLSGHVRLLTAGRYCCGDRQGTRGAVN